jgi:DNA-binding MarR family transcriptional regulator
MHTERQPSVKSKAQRARSRQPVPAAADGNAIDLLSKPALLALDQFKLENVTSHLLRRAHFAAEDVFAREFAAEAITPRQKAALIAVYQQPGVNQNALAALLFMDRNTIAEMASRLAKRGLLKRLPASGDRRAYQLFLTPKGISLLGGVILRDGRVEQKIIEAIPAKDRPVFLRCLRLLAQLR